MPRQQSRDVAFVRQSEHARGRSGTGQAPSSVSSSSTSSSSVLALPFGTCFLSLQPLWPEPSSATIAAAGADTTVVAAAVLLAPPAGDSTSASTTTTTSSLTPVVNTSLQRRPAALLCDAAALVRFAKRPGRAKGRSPASGNRMRLESLLTKRHGTGADTDTEQQQQQQQQQRQAKTELQSPKRPADGGSAAAVADVVDVEAVEEVDAVFWDSAGEAFPVAVSLNAVGRPHCRMTFKEFSPNSSIVAVRRRVGPESAGLAGGPPEHVGADSALPTEYKKAVAYVYALDAITALAASTRSGRHGGRMLPDPVSGDPFDPRTDVVVLQAPASSNDFLGGSLREGLLFMHQIEQSQGVDSQHGGLGHAAQLLKQAGVSARTQDAVARIRQQSDEKAAAAAAAARHDNGDLHARGLLSGQSVASSATALAMAPSVTSAGFAGAASVAMAHSDGRAALPKEVSEKGFVRLHTTQGPMDLLLHCDLAPKTCENFLGLCREGYYDGTAFHRLIPGFCVQGGDPTGTGRGGRSLWGTNDNPRPFADEFYFIKQLQHSFRGVLSMANSGPDSNKSQFFITFSPQAALTGKHTVFGRVVARTGTVGERSHATLDAIEGLDTDANDRPIAPLVLARAEVLHDPFSDATDQAPAHLAPERVQVPAISSAAARPSMVGPPSASGRAPSTAVAAAAVPRRPVSFTAGRSAGINSSQSNHLPLQPVGGGGIGAFLLQRQQQAASAAKGKPRASSSASPAVRRSAESPLDPSFSASDSKRPRTG